VNIIKERPLALLGLALGAAAVITVGAHAQPIVQDAQRVATWAIALIKAVAVIIIIAGFAMFAVGRHHWAGGIAMAIGVIGAAKADLIAQYFIP
jgi:hypothetical protein